MAKFNYDIVSKQILSTSEGEVFMYVNILTCIMLIYKAIEWEREKAFELEEKKRKGIYKGPVKDKTRQSQDPKHAPEGIHTTE